ncbi:MAG: sodium:proton antiporter [Candidatus Omnitrophica bacterium]|nr:sodium:proton antiporter [Candidatus Omnitrophota bacterium]MCM8809362.1 sodium:proton antiporter [Candidatus Omnitrophota bacterium]MCM8832633.1 sodium:proton antiporter [Candidatus Omnitrophota bacterium]
MIVYIAIVVMFFVGIYGMIVKKNIIKMIIGVNIIGYALNLFFIVIGYRNGGIAPILVPGMTIEEFVSKAVNPLPQALVLTSIVIDLSIICFLASLSIRIYEKYGSFDLEKIRRLKG